MKIRNFPEVEIGINNFCYGYQTLLLPTCPHHFCPKPTPIYPPSCSVLVRDLDIASSSIQCPSLVLPNKIQSSPWDHKFRSLFILLRWYHVAELALSPAWKCYYCLGAVKVEKKEP